MKEIWIVVVCDEDLTMDCMDCELFATEQEARKHADACEEEGIYGVVAVFNRYLPE